MTLTPRLRPSEWLRRCPDCDGTLTLPVERHLDCEERRRWDARAIPACSTCGYLNGRHATTCPTSRERGTHA